MSSQTKQQVFVSYSRVNKDFAIKLAKELKASGFSVWLDVLDIPAGARWDNEVEKALAECSIFMVILTPTSSASDNVKDEIGYAIDTGKRIVPVLLESSTIPLRLRRFQYVDFTSKSYDEGIESARILLSNLNVKPGESVDTQQSIEKKYTPNPDTKTQRTRLLMVVAGVFVILFLGLGGNYLFKNKEPVATDMTQSSQSIPTKLAATNTSSVEPTLEMTQNTAVGSPTETSIPLTPTLGITSSTVGEDGMTLLYVPAGDFSMGSNLGETNERPVHLVSLSAFWIDKTEVTNAMYVVFLNEQGNQVDGGVNWLDARDNDVRIHQSGSEWVVEAGYENHPVVEVSWYGALAYCEWTGRVLPTEAQWEKAARGTDEWAYPWGNDASGNGILNYNNFFKDTTVVGRYPKGASPYGALDMAGNVSEWVSDWFGEAFYQISPDENPSGPSSGRSRIRRGGSYFDHDYVVRSTYRAASDPDFTDVKVGFRCAMDAP